MSVIHLIVDTMCDAMRFVRMYFGEITKIFSSFMQ